MKKLIRRLRDNVRDDSGIVTFYFVIMVVAFLAIVSLVIYGAGKVQADQRLYSTAAGAARAAANAVSGEAIINGTADIDSRSAISAANGYLNAAGVSGSVAVNGSRITVIVRSNYTPPFAPIASPIQATATAELITQ